MVDNWVIETNVDRNAWNEYLMEFPKEKLIDFMLDCMSADLDFGETVYFSLSAAVGTVESVMNEYRQAVERELERDDASTDRFILLTQRVCEYAAHLDDENVKKQIYSELADILEYAVENGAGCVDECELMVWDMIEELREGTV